MQIIKNPETKGILALVLIIIVVAGVMAATSGKLEQWFGITLFSGPQAMDKIVFVSERDGAPDIYLMETDGTQAKRLTQNAKPKSLPAISPAGNRVVFVAGAGDMDQVFSVGVNGGAHSQVTTATGPKFEPAYNPNGKALSFIASGKVYSATLDGSKLETILPTPQEIRESMVAVEGSRGAQVLYSSYAWGPGGTSVAGVTKDGGGNDYLVYLSDLAAEPLRIALAPPGQRTRVQHMSWAANESLLAVSLMAGNKHAIRLFNPQAVGNPNDHPIITLMEGENLTIGRPALSPDGTKVIMPVDDEKQTGLILCDLTNGKAAPLAVGKFEDPCFSPDGNRILATRIGGEKERDVVVIAVSTGQVTDLTTDGKSYRAIWTPTVRK